LDQQTRERKKTERAGWSEKRQTIVFIVVVVCIIVVIMLVGSLLPGESTGVEAPTRVPTVPKGLDN
jgi:hypothetical protein